MTNAFDSAYYKTTEPTEIISGDRIAWKRTDIGADYDPASYTLSYSARLEGAVATEISITASESGSDYIVEVTHTTTAGWTVGRYHWQAYITRTSDSARATLGYGVWEVKANADASTADPRSHARIVLQNIETAIQALSSRTAKAYTINGRSMTYADLPELERMRDKYRAEAAAEDRKANGTGGGKLVVRFGR